MNSVLFLIIPFIFCVISMISGYLMGYFVGIEKGKLEEAIYILKLMKGKM